MNNELRKLASGITTQLWNGYGTLADIDGPEAVWVGWSLELGEQTLTIKWTDENSNTGSAEMTLTVREINILVF